MLTDDPPQQHREDISTSPLHGVTFPVSSTKSLSMQNEITTLRIEIRLAIMTPSWIWMSAQSSTGRMGVADSKISPVASIFAAVTLPFVVTPEFTTWVVVST